MSAPPWLEPVSRRAFAFFGSLAVTSGLLWLAMTNAYPPARSAITANAINLWDVIQPSRELIDKSPDRSAEAEIKPVAVSPDIPPMPPAAPSEWHIQKVQVTIAESVTGPSASGPSGNGSQVYDPYAGASPARATAAGLPNAYDAGLIRPRTSQPVDPLQIFAGALRFEFMRTYPDLKGELVLAVTIASDGRITGARVVRSTTDHRQHKNLLEIAMGKQLNTLQSSVGKTVILPPMKFG